MADQVEASKIVAYAATGSPTDTVSVPKLVAYMILVPGDIVAGDTSRQGYVYSQIIRRD